MKRVLVAAGIVALAVTAAAGARPLAVPTKKPGKLIVGFDLPAPSFWNGRATGTTIKNPSGFEYALSQAIAKKLGITKVQYLRAPFGGLFSPAPKKFDFAFEEVTITSERAKVVSFSAPYFDANQGVLLSKKAKTPKSNADLKSMQTCAQTDTTDHALRHDGMLRRRSRNCGWGRPSARTSAVSCPGVRSAALGTIPPRGRPGARGTRSRLLIGRPEFSWCRTVTTGAARRSS